MSKAFLQLFWGFVFVFVDINIGRIDILPDAVGYAIILFGTLKLMTEFPVGKKAYHLSQILIVIAIPEMFIPKVNFPDAYKLTDVTVAYTFILVIINLILVFFLFQLMLEVVGKYGSQGWNRQINIFASIYIMGMLVIDFTQTFMVNLYGNGLMVTGIITAVISLGLQLTLLICLYKLKRWAETIHDKMDGE